MAAYEPTDRGAARAGSPLELYVRQLLRDADRVRRSTQPRTRSVRADWPLEKPVAPPPQSPATDHRPPIG